MTYADALSGYHLSAESKFANARPFETGRTARRHIVVRSVKLIGKEANKIGEFGEADPVGAACAEYDVANIGPVGLPSLTG